MRKISSVWIAAAILVIAVILRPPVAQIGPILDLIQTKLMLNNAQTALLAAAPVFCFGSGAFATPALVRRLGLNQTMVGLLAVLVVSIAARPYLGFYGLLIGTTLAGLSIAVANVLLPTVVRARFPKKVVPLTAAYTTILAASASFAAAISYPTADALGWQIALELWALPACLALLLSFALLSGSKSREHSELEDHSDDFKLISRSPIAWSIIGLFGIQSLGFYALLAWLPNLAIDSGMNPADAGALLSLMTVIGVPVGMLLSANFGKFKSLAPVGAMISMVTIAGLTLLLLKLWIPAVIVIGIGQASSFPLSLSLISTRAGNQRLTTMLSSVSQGVGYLLAAGGTFLFGWVAKATGNWQASVIGLIALTIIQVVAAWYAGRPRVIQ